MHGWAARDPRGDRCRHLCPVVTLLTVCLAVTALRSAESDSLQPDAAVVDAVAGQVRLACCDNATIAGAMKRRDKACLIASHLYQFVRWRSSVDSTVAGVLDDTRARLAGFSDTVTYAVDTTGCSWAGRGRVQVCAYVHGDCGLCKKVVGDLYDSVTVGTLGARARLLTKPFGSGLGERALVVAQQHGKFWELFALLRPVKVRLTADMLCDMADSLGIGGRAMRKGLTDPSVIAVCERSTEEARANGVTVTPTLFIDNHRYASFKNPEWVTDGVGVWWAGGCRR